MVRRTLSCQHLLSIHCRYPIVVKVTDVYSGIQMFGNNLYSKLSTFFLSRNDRLFTRSRICKRKSPLAHGLHYIAFYAFTKYLGNWEFQFIVIVSCHLPEGTGNKQANLPSNLVRSTDILFWTVRSKIVLYYIRYKNFVVNRKLSDMELKLIDKLSHHIQRFHCF